MGKEIKFGTSISFNKIPEAWVIDLFSNWTRSRESVRTVSFWLASPLSKIRPRMVVLTNKVTKTIINQKLDKTYQKSVQDTEV